MTPLTFEILARSRRSNARVGVVSTPHGRFHTPAFMPVGTKATVKGILPPLVAATGAEILLNNTFHLMLRPGPERIHALGGVHRFMGWNRPILTDSGGFQVFSLSDSNAIDDEGVTFKSPVDGSSVRLTPERSIHVQNLLGPDIIMAFDDCPPSPPAAQPDEPDADDRPRPNPLREVPRPATREEYLRRLDRANERTVRWLERCIKAHARPHDQALFGIVQGGTDPERRAWSASRICALDLPGFAIGGVAVGESTDAIASVVRSTAPLLPDLKPRYLMGVGYERDILAAVLAGVDMFDCVLPTRNGRNAYAFTRAGPLRLRNQRFEQDPDPIEPGCDCPACAPAAHGWHTPDQAPLSRAYLRHLFQADEMLGPILLTLHNLRHFQRLMADLRSAVRSDDWAALAAGWPILAGALADAGLGSTREPSPRADAPRSTTYPSRSDESHDPVG